MPSLATGGVVLIQGFHRFPFSFNATLDLSSLYWEFTVRSSRYFINILTRISFLLMAKNHTKTDPPRSLLYYHPYLFFLFLKLDYDEACPYIAKVRGFIQYLSAKG